MMQAKVVLLPVSQGLAFVQASCTSALFPVTIVVDKLLFLSMP